MYRRMIPAAVAGAAAVLLLAGCTSPEATRAPAPTVTVTAEPGTANPDVGDELTPLAAWDICFAHTFAQTRSDVTEWSPFSEELVEQPSTGTFIVTIENVRSEGDLQDFGTVTCQVEGRVGGAIIAEWFLS